MRKSSLLIVFALILIVFSGKTAESAVSLSSPLCAGPFPDVTMPAPMHSLRYNCSVNVQGTANKLFHLGIFTLDYVTPKVSGNGSNIDFTTPDALRYRFRAAGAAQAGGTENITIDNRGASVTKLIDAITSDGTYTFDLIYDTYEADVGETVYSQPFTLGIYKTGGEETASIASSLSFTIANYLYIYKYAAPAVTVTPGLAYFDKNTYYEAEQVLIEIAVNNQWDLKPALSGDLSSGGDSAYVNDNYFKCSGSGFVNLASDFTQFAVANQYYPGAQNTVGEYTTGSSDGKSLNNKQIQFIYGFKNSQVYVPGGYTTTVNYRLYTR